MGYTTEFTGSIKLGRNLAMTEARELLELAEGDIDHIRKATGIHAYFQWVPADTLQHIVWDGNEKFYKYEEQIEWLCEWLLDRDISANGSLYWQGEELGDTGTLTVTDNVVASHPNMKPSSNSLKPLTLDSLKPLTLDGLGRLLLAQVTA